MAFDFERIIAFAQRFQQQPLGTELGFVLSEWTSGEPLGLETAYPAVREDLPPTEDAPASRARQMWARLNGGPWQQVISVGSVTNVGLGRVGVLTGGVGNSMEIIPWPAKNVAVAWVIAPTATMSQINADRAEGVVLIRVMVNEGDGDNPLAPEEPFTQAQVAVLGTWLNDHSITDAEFADLFDISASELAAWLKGHPRWRFAQQIHNRFG